VNIKSFYNKFLLLKIFLNLSFPSGRQVYDYRVKLELGFWALDFFDELNCLIEVYEAVLDKF
jgi:hypothetical protein